MSSRPAPLSPVRTDHPFLQFAHVLLSPKVCNHLKCLEPAAKATSPTAAAAATIAPTSPTRSSGTAARLPLVIVPYGSDPDFNLDSDTDADADSDVDSAERASDTGSPAGRSLKIVVASVTSPTAGISAGSRAPVTTTLSVPLHSPSMSGLTPVKSAWLRHHADSEEQKKKVDFSQQVVIIPSIDYAAANDLANDREDTDADSDMPDA